MPTPLAKIQKDADENILTLSFNGYPAVQRFICDNNRTASLYSEENIIIFVIKGKINIRCANSTHEVNRKKMVFIKRNTFFELEEHCGFSSGAKTEYIQFFLTKELVKEFTKIAVVCGSSVEDLFPVVISSIHTQLRHYISSMKPYIHAAGKVETNLVKIKTFELLFCLSKIHNEIIAQLLDTRDHFRSNITAMVEENITNPISLKDLATLTGRSLSSFRRDFLAIYKVPPSKWIRQRKLEKSKELLVGTTMTITDICYMTGFGNITHFSKLFKSQFGYPPSSLRMNLAG